MNGEIDRKTARQIVDTVKDICGHDINFINAQGMIIASTDSRRIGTFHEIGRRVIRTGLTAEVAEDTEFQGTQKGVNIPVVHNGNVAAVIGISGEPEEVRKYAYLMQKISTLILREHDLDFQNNSRKSRMNYVIRTLIHSGEISQKYLEEFLNEYSLDKDQRFYTILIRPNPQRTPDNLFLMEQKIYQTFEMAGALLYTFDYPNEYILFLSEENTKKKWNLFEKLAMQWEGSLQISRGSLQTLERQALSYEAASLVMKSLGGKRQTGIYEEIDLELILGSVSEEVRSLFLQKTVNGLDREDVELLRIYFEEDRSLKKTSERLCLHKNTLQYRLDRIFRECGYNPRVFRDAVVLYSALKLLAV